MARQYEGAALRKAVKDALARDAKLNSLVKSREAEVADLTSKLAAAEAKLLALQVTITKAAQEALTITPQTTGPNGRVAKCVDLPGWKHVQSEVIAVIGDGKLGAS